MRQQVGVPARQGDLDRKIHRAPQDLFQRRAHASLVVPQFSRCKLFFSALALRAAGWSMLDGKDGYKLEPLKR
jgi:hypothetical protein